MEENLEELIRLFYEDKKQLDNYKKSTEEYNKMIKDGLKELGTDVFETDDLVAKITVQNRESFNEEKLIEKLEEFGIISPIKTVKVIDYEELENVIYNGTLNAKDISDCKTSKQVITLKVNERKDK